MSESDTELERLREKYIELQADIAFLIPAQEGDRANDPIIHRVERLCRENEELRETLMAIVGDDPEDWGAGSQRTASRWRHSSVAPSPQRPNRRTPVISSRMPRQMERKGEH